MERDVETVDVTIVIPVYNVEQYIRANVESIIALKNPNMEFLYIDDGSPDRSVAILEEYQKRDNRIRIVRRENGGLSAARNTGISEAKGKWTLFVDGDDWIDSKLAEELMSEASEENDIVWGTYEIVNSEGKLERSRCDEDLPFRKVKDGMEWVLDEKVTCAPWVYLYKTQLLQDNKVIFPEGFLHEDMEFIPEIFYYAKNVKYTGIPFYRYVNREGSISRTKNVKRTTDLIQIAEHLEVFEKDNVNNLEYKKYLRTYRGMICAEALHVAILNEISLQFVFIDNMELRNLAIHYLLNSTRKRDKIAALIIACHLHKLYEKMYLWYNNQHNRTIRKAIGCGTKCDSFNNNTSI